jgi:hypothetical protein
MSRLTKILLFSSWQFLGDHDKHYSKHGFLLKNILPLRPKKCHEKKNCILGSHDVSLITLDIGMITKYWHDFSNVYTEIKSI